MIFVIIHARKIQSGGEFMTNEELWGGIRNLAKKFNISCSKLAKISGLDSTVFNYSKAQNKYGQRRWISTWTLSQVLDATNLTLAEFSSFLPSDTHTYPKYNHFPTKPRKGIGAKVSQNKIPKQAS